MFYNEDPTAAKFIKTGTYHRISFCTRWPYHEDLRLRMSQAYIAVKKIMQAV